MSHSLWMVGKTHSELTNAFLGALFHPHALPSGEFFHAGLPPYLNPGPTGWVHPPKWGKLPLPHLELGPCLPAFPGDDNYKEWEISLTEYFLANPPISASSPTFPTLDITIHLGPSANSKAVMCCGQNLNRGHTCPTCHKFTSQVHPAVKFDVSCSFTS